MGNVFQVMGDQLAQHLGVRRLRRQLQKQRFAEIAGADAGRVELLDDVQRFLDLGRRRAFPVAGGQFLQFRTAATQRPRGLVIRIVLKF